MSRPRCWPTRRSPDPPWPRPGGGRRGAGWPGPPGWPPRCWCSPATGGCRRPSRAIRTARCSPCRRGTCCTATCCCTAGGCPTFPSTPPNCPSTCWSSWSWDAARMWCTWPRRSPSPLVLLLAAALARGQATGLAAIRIVIAAGIMCSPQPGAGVFLFLLAPDHYGSTVPVLLAWLILDRASAALVCPGRGRRAARLGPGGRLGGAAHRGAAAAHGVRPSRLYHHAVQQRQALPTRGDSAPGAPRDRWLGGNTPPARPPHQPMAHWFDAALLAAGLLATAAAAAALHLNRSGGRVPAEPGQLAAHLDQRAARPRVPDGGRPAE